MTMPTIPQVTAALEMISVLFNRPPERRGDGLQEMLADLDGAGVLTKKLKHFVLTVADQVLHSTDTLISDLNRRIGAALEREQCADAVSLKAFGWTGLVGGNLIAADPATLAAGHPAKDWVLPDDLYQLNTTSAERRVLLLGSHGSGRTWFRRAEVLALTAREVGPQQQKIRERAEDEARAAAEFQRQREMDTLHQTRDLKSRVAQLEREVAELRGEPTATQEHSGHRHAEPAASH